MTHPQLLLGLAHLAEVEAAPLIHRAHQYGPEFTAEHYPPPTLADLFSLGEEHREAMTRARELGVTAVDHARVRTWFAGGNRDERRSRERSAA